MGTRIGTENGIASEGCGFPEKQNRRAFVILYSWVREMWAKTHLMIISLLCSCRCLLISVTFNQSFFFNARVKKYDLAIAS